MDEQLRWARNGLGVGATTTSLAGLGLLKHGQRRTGVGLLLAGAAAGGSAILVHEMLHYWGAVPPPGAAANTDQLPTPRTVLTQRGIGGNN